MRKRLFNYVVSRLRDPQLTQEEFNCLVQMWNAVDSESFEIMFHGYFEEDRNGGEHNGN